MRKRLKKKIGKRRCLKCGSHTGMRAVGFTPKGRLVYGPFNCLYCDMGAPRESLQELRDAFNWGDPEEGGVVNEMD